jgi:hypothetical protein
MFEVGAGGFRVVMSNDAPHGLDERRVAVDRPGSADEDRPEVYVLVHRAGGAPTLLVVGRTREGFGCGVHVVPDTGVMFFGCGESVCAYDMATGTRLHQDITPYAFHSWNRHGEVVLMSGELEVAAFALDGTKLWSAAVESPWDYGVTGENMYTLVMGHKVEFPLKNGPGDRALVERETA